MAQYVCYYCREEVQPDARKCKHCGEILDHSLRKGQSPGEQGIDFIKLVILVIAVAAVLFYASAQI